MAWERVARNPSPPKHPKRSGEAARPPTCHQHWNAGFQGAADGARGSQIQTVKTRAMASTTVRGGLTWVPTLPTPTGWS